MAKLKRPHYVHDYVQLNLNMTFVHLIENISKCQKDVKLSKRCQMSKSQTSVLWRRFTEKINEHNEVHRYLTSILMSHMMASKNTQNVHKKYF